MELKIEFETEIEYSDNTSLDSDWFKIISNFIHNAIFSLNKNYLSVIERRRERREQRKRLLDYPQFYFKGYIKFFTRKKEIVFPFDCKENSISSFIKTELCPIVLYSHFLEEDRQLFFNKQTILSENEPTTLSIRLKLNLVEKI